MTKNAPLDVPETSLVEERQISCDGTNGGNKALGHPLIYLKIGKAGFIECPYCDHRFILKS